MSCSWHRFCKTARTRYKVRVDKIRVWSRQTSFTRRLVEAEAGGMIHTRYLVYQVPRVSGTWYSRSSQPEYTAAGGGAGAGGGGGAGAGASAAVGFSRTHISRGLWLIMRSRGPGFLISLEIFRSNTLMQVPAVTFIYTRSYTGTWYRTRQQC